jgi:hypothetical protein
MRTLILLCIALPFFLAPQLRAQSEERVDATLCGINKGELTVQEILECGRIMPADTVNYKVKEFRMIIELSSGAIIEKSVTGNVFPADFKDIFSKFRKGQKIYFEGIKADKKEGGSEDLASMVITVKE